MKNSTALNVNTSNMLNATLLFDQLDKLCTKRQNWEDGTYQQSNVELYGILAECLDLYEQVSGSVGLRRKLAAALKQRKLKTNTNASLETRIVKWVFGDCGKRTYTYAAVLSIAHEAGVDALKLPTWIVANNGIENIRRAASNSNSPAKIDFENLAIDEFVSAPALSVVSKKVSDLAPNSKATHSYSAALVRQNKSGDFEIVFASNRISTVNSLLIDAGQQIHRASKAKSVAAKTVTQSKSVSSAIAATVGAKN